MEDRSVPSSLAVSLHGCEEACELSDVGDGLGVVGEPLAPAGLSCSGLCQPFRRRSGAVGSPLRLGESLVVRADRAGSAGKFVCRDERPRRGRRGCPASPLPGWRRRLDRLGSGCLQALLGGQGAVEFLSDGDECLGCNGLAAGLLGEPGDGGAPVGAGGAADGSARSVRRPCVMPT